MRPLVLLLLAGCDIGLHYDTNCVNDIFKRGIHSVLPLNCDLAELNAQRALDAVVAATTITDRGYRQRMQHVQVIVRSVDYWNATVTGESISGITYAPDSITIGASGFAWAHESLHAYDAQGYLENFWSFLAEPVESVQNAEHYQWTEKGYWLADETYTRTFCPLQGPPGVDCP